MSKKWATKQHWQHSRQNVHLFLIQTSFQPSVVKKRRNGVNVSFCCPSRRIDQKISTTGESNECVHETNASALIFHLTDGNTQLFCGIVDVTIPFFFRRIRETRFLNVRCQEKKNLIFFRLCSKLTITQHNTDSGYF